jgi:hypothetical protein
MRATDRVAVALTADPAGTVATRFAGLADFHAALWWDEAPTCAPSCLPSPNVSFRHDLCQTASPCGTQLEVRGTIRAFTGTDLGVALDRAMRAAGDAAAVSGAVLEMRALLVAAPRAVDPSLAQELATDLWAAGIGARFAPCWEPAKTGPPAVGVGGGPDLTDFLSNHDRWRPSA